MGGKGIGRLLWLDFFEEIHVNSVFDKGGERKRRRFRFVLSLDDQVQDLQVTSATPETSTSFFVRFSGLRDNGYRDKFPGRGNFVFQHFTSHFLPIFIGTRCPQVEVHIGSETRQYPEAINAIVRRRESEIPLDTQQYGMLYLTLMECDKVASADLKGSHFVHFIAHDRTVYSQNIDGKLGLKYFGLEEDRVFHGILRGQFLDESVNQ